MQALKKFINYNLNIINVEIRQAIKASISIFNELIWKQFYRH